MKRIDQEDRSASFVLPPSPSLRRGRLSSSSSWNPADRSDGALAPPHRYAKRCGREYWTVGIQNPDFCGLSLELLARADMDNETVLPKAVKTAGIIMTPRSYLGLASDAIPRRAATISLERRVVSKQ